VRAESRFDPTDPDAVQEERLKRIRRLRACGEHFAKIAGLEQCLRTEGSTWIRLGYLVIDFPDVKRCSAAAGNERQRQFLAWSWWTLVWCCDLCLVNEHLAQRHPDPTDAQQARVELYGAGSRFVAAWRDANTVTAAIRQTVGHADPFGYSDYVDAASPDLWAADMALRQAYRDIRAFGSMTGVDVVGDPFEPDL
jgi:hypothetical protein